ncbi:hypothetical protein SMAC4_13132 [Sordaria macrospora]|uniref:uncharacterized protein n=1 Tax=Sordaria macrospora TaxID=5147 RepID=UPI002B2F31C7|nr:hypothetical protein SMAC4_13132 [Sordaria macrospora]
MSSRHGQTKSVSTPRLTAPRRARTPSSNIVPTRPSTSDSFDTHSSLRDDRRCLPSYRDTASEIISMYASDSQRSAHSPFSPKYHDDQRSFSMTSCSSRALPNKSSNGTMQSQASGPALQRPRSPFPYPTRLKRPGIRPSSPAVTESGAVDYSRMVEIDRVSQRTTHGSYRPMYAQYGRRAGPAMSRLHPYGSVSSLPSHKSRPGPRPYARTNSSGSPAWGPGLRKQLEMESSDQSTRTPSLTSIVDMYRSPSGTSSDLRHMYHEPPNGTFYYDYSEDFDTFPDGNSAWAGPLAPIPTRAPNMHRARILSDGNVGPFLDINRYPPPDDPYESPQYYSAGTKDTKAHEPNITPDSIEENEAEEGSFAFPDVAPRNGSMVGRKDVHGATNVSPLQATATPSTGMKKSCHDSDTQIPEKTDDLAVSAAGSPGRLSRSDVRRVTVHDGSDGPQDDVNDNQRSSFGNNTIQGHRPEDHLSLRTSLYRSNSEPLDKRQSIRLNAGERCPSTFSGYLRRSKFFSIEPGLSDLASLVDYLDVAAKSASDDYLPQPNLTMDFPDLSAEPGDQTSTVQAIPDSLDNQSEDQGPGFEECLRTKNPKPFGHQRKLALPRIRTSGFSTPFSQDPPCTTSRSEPVILQPLPVSPVKRLRLQNSVPKLMKALPDLPSSPARSEPCLYSAPDGKREIPKHFPSSLRPDMPFDCYQEYTQTPSCGVKTTMARAADSEDAPALEKHFLSRDSASNSMKLKVSRAAMIRAQEELKKLQNPVRVETATLELTNPPEISAFSFQKGCDPTMLDTVSVSDRHGVGCGTCTEEKAFILTSAASAPVTASSRVPGPQAARNHVATSQSVKTIRPPSPCELRSSFSVSDRQSRLPKRTLSRIRERLAQPRSRSTEPLTSRNRNKEACDHICPASPITPSYIRQKDTSMSTALAVTDGESADTAKQQSRGFRKCMCKWMRTARQAFLVACTGSTNP